MTFGKRLLCLLLALLLVLPLLISCGGNTPEDPCDPEEEQLPEIEHTIDLTADGYTIIAPGGSGDEVKGEQDAAMKLYSTIYQQTRIKLDYYNDEMDRGSDPELSRTEILIGNTNRTESISARAELRVRDYSITYEDGRIVILGGSAEATMRAVDHFIKTYLNVDEKTLTVYENRNDAYHYPYLVGDLSVNGVPLSKYTIVYPRGSKSKDPLTYYTAVALSDYLLTNAGISLKVVSDTSSEKDYEILVGETNRTASKISTSALRDDQFYLHTDGDKVVMLGDSYMVAGAAGELVNNYFRTQGTNVDIDATAIPKKPTAKTHAFEKATSAILLIGDGMGFNHIDYTLDSNMLSEFVAFDLPGQSSCTTVSQSVINGDKAYTDSAAAATALATGYKTLNGYLGMDPTKTERQNVRELAHSRGARTAVITTDTLTGATPAGFLCHYKDRTKSKELQAQIDALVDDGLVDFVYGSNTELITPSREGLNLVSEGDSDFFVMIEEAHIDKKAHYANSQGVWDSVVRYNEIISYVICFVMLHPDTALIITADHETGGLVKNDDGSYSFENFAYTESDGDDYYQHTSAETPLFALGYGTESLTNDVADNTEIAKFIASIYGETDFGQ